MNANDFLPLNFKDIKDYSELFNSSRRGFLKRFGGGIVIFMALSDVVAQEGAVVRRIGGNRNGMPTDFNAFLRIDENGHVQGFTGKIEMGQGPITSLGQMLAEELDVPAESVEMVMGDTDLCPWDMGTWGSMTTRFFGPALRSAAAEARAVLIDLAAEKLQVPATQLAVKDGVVFDQQNKDHKVTYGELAKGQKIARQAQVHATPKDQKLFTVSGKSFTRRDGELKATGKAHYAGDIRLPGMLYAKILRPPSHAAKRTSVNTDAVKDVPGAQVVQTGDLVAVLHEFPDVAEQGLEKIKAEYDVPDTTLTDKTIFDHLLSKAPPSNGRGAGDLDEGKKQAAKSVESTYLNGYVAHSPMEPHAALANIENGKATVWVSTQNPFGARDTIARALGFQTADVRVITPFVGGGFGGKTDNQQAVEAAMLAKAVGKPVQVMWTREEEFFYDHFRPAAVVKISSGVDAGGKMTYWNFDTYFAGDRGSELFYSTPNHRTASHGSGFGGDQAHPFATGAWRAPGNNTNTYARESHIDALAVAAGMDPVEFRLKNLTDERMIRVLKAAADKFGWTPAKGPSKRGYGVACGMDAGAWVAAIAAVEVAKDGSVQVKRVVCAQDMGQVINPEGATIQMEGCITMGLGYALTEEVHFKGGQVLDTNYDTYELPHFSWLPKIETVIVDSDQPPGGGGEPAIILMGGLIANAVHDATGARLYQLPMTADRIKEAVKKV